uniref:uncharacterized protein LOC122596867 n=1 Tax=Erigeron canadensis TaxID=72917 RepID=UPI001CB91F86|nr:uncharacterized protein LOC122596867 [Erigeron canadensis]
MERNEWMYELGRHTTEYQKHLNDFMKVAEDDRVLNGNDRISCPCVDCKNCEKYDEARVIYRHLVVKGFVPGYTCWTYHGESLVDSVISEGNINEIGANNINDDSYDNSDPDNFTQMFNVLENEVGENDNVDENDKNNEDDNGDANKNDGFQQVFADSKEDLYEGCKKYSKLSAVLRLFNVKANHNWSDKSFKELLKVFHDMLPVGNKLPVSLYETKKMYERKKQTKVSGNVTKNGPPAKVLWYFPIIPRLKRLFASPEDAKLLRWHEEERKKDGKLRHVADSPQWRNIDHTFDEFGNEIRNIRFGLSSDGINPFGNMSSRHSTWPVLLCIYNLPPWLCMKPKYIMMSLLIQGPKQPGNEIDVYLSPLIDDLKTLWSPGVQVYDGYLHENFQQRAMIFCTISDFPAYGNLSGYGTKVAKACPICQDYTCSRWLKYCKKTVYMGHPYCNMDNLFDGYSEFGSLPPPSDGETVFSQVENFQNEFGKTKDGFNARKDMVDMKIRPELAPQENSDGKRTYLPAACYTLSKDE